MRREAMRRKYQGKPIERLFHGTSRFRSGRFELQELLDGLDVWLNANVKLVITQLEPRLILSQLLVRLIVSPTALPY
jgi:hypothetical protein